MWYGSRRRSVSSSRSPLTDVIKTNKPAHQKTYGHHFDYHYPKAILIHLVSDESTSTINKRQADSKGMRRNMEFILSSDILGWERIYSQISWAPKHKDLTSIFVVVVVLLFFPIFFGMFAWLICLMPFGSPFSHQVQSDYWLALIDLNLNMLLWLN